MVMNSPNCSTCLFSWYRLLIWSVVSVVSVVTSVRPHCTALTVKIWSIKVTKPNELELNKSYYRQQLLQILNVAVSLIYYVSLTRDCIKWPTDVTIIEIEIEIVFLTENWIESKSYFSCIPSNDLSIEALDGLLTPSRFNRQTRDHTVQRGRSSVFKLFICRWRPPAGLEWERGEGGGQVLFLDKQGPRTDIGR